MSLSVVISGSTIPELRKFLALIPASTPLALVMINAIHDNFLPLKFTDIYGTVTDGSASIRYSAEKIAKIRLVEESIMQILRVTFARGQSLGVDGSIPRNDEFEGVEIDYGNAMVRHHSKFLFFDLINHVQGLDLHAFSIFSHSLSRTPFTSQEEMTVHYLNYQHGLCRIVDWLTHQIESSIRLGVEARVNWGLPFGLNWIEYLERAAPRILHQEASRRNLSYEQLIQHYRVDDSAAVVIYQPMVSPSSFLLEPLPYDPTFPIFFPSASDIFDSNSYLHSVVSLASALRDTPSPHAEVFDPGYSSLLWRN